MTALIEIGLMLYFEYCIFTYFPNQVKKIGFTFGQNIMERVHDTDVNV